MVATAAEGRAAAESLLRELAFSADISAYHKSKLVDRVYDSAPPRSELAFQTVAGEAAVRAVHGAALEAEDRFIFCLLHGGFTPRPGIDAEHAFSFSVLKTRQERLLRFLNDDSNKEFVDAFLAVPGMSDLFKVDKGQVKGTGYFYKLCYNNDSNMWLLCHACNIVKSNAEFLEWAKKQSALGDAFVESVAKCGELQQGILFDRIAKSDDAEDTFVEIEGQKIRVTKDLGVGYGQFIREWFLATRGKELAVHKDFYSKNYKNVKARLAEIRELADSGKFADAEKAYARLLRLVRRMRMVQQASAEQEARYSDSSGGEGPAPVKAFTDELVTGMSAEMTDKAHYYKRMFNSLVKAIGDQSTVQAMLADYDFKNLSVAGVRFVCQQIQELIASSSGIDARLDPALLEDRVGDCYAAALARDYELMRERLTVARTKQRASSVLTGGGGGGGCGRGASEELKAEVSAPALERSLSAPKCERPDAVAAVRAQRLKVRPAKDAVLRAHTTVPRARSVPAFLEETIKDVGSRKRVAKQQLDPWVDISSNGEGEVRCKRAAL